MTTEDLISNTRDHRYGKLSKSAYTLLVRGEREASDKTLIILGDALGSRPGEWPEYDMARARAALNPRLVDPEIAHANFQRVRDLLLPSTGSDLAALLEDAADRKDERSREPSASSPKSSRRQGRER